MDEGEGQSSQESIEQVTSPPAFPMIFPLEILMHIMQQIPNREKMNLMQTCKALYRYGSELLSYRSPLVLRSEQLGDERLYISIKESLRRFRSLKLFMKEKELCLIKFYNLLRILSIHGPYIERLSWEFCERIIITPQEILTILNRFPNIRTLFVSGSKSFFLDDLWPEDASLNSLTKLKTIEFQNVPKGFGKIILKLPNNIVTDFKFTGMLDGLGDFLLHQSLTLENLKISEKCVDPHMFRCLKIKKLFYCVSDDHIATNLSGVENRFLIDVIRNQPMLTQLLFCTHSAIFNTGGVVFEMSHELTQAIFNLRNLKELEIGPTQHNIQGISRLKMLKGLSLQDCDSLIWSHHALQELSQVKFEKLERIDLFCCETVLREHFFENLGKSCPNLKRLLVTNDEVLTINTYFNNFPKLEYLEVGCFKEFFHYYNYDGKVHTNLKTLIIMTESANEQLHRLSPSLFEALPCLNRIYIAAPVRYDIAVLRALAASKIKIISIHFEYTEPELVFTTEKEMIKDMKQNAKHIDVTIEKQDFLYN